MTLEEQRTVHGVSRGALLVVGAVVVVLTAASFGYGFHRDELYFLAASDHLAWGYPDQPPVTPLLAWLGNAISPGSLWALRIPATLCAAGIVLLVALTAREMGATRRGQFLAAACVGASGYALIFGHLLLTITTDLCCSAAVAWLVARLIRTGDQRLLAVLGVVVGVGLLNKTLIALLVAALLLSIVAVGPRTVLRGKWLAAAVVIAALLWLPNLLWQAQHGWPQLEMMEVLAAKEYMGGRAGFVPFQFLLFSPILSPVWICGLVRLLRAPAARPFRAFGVAYLAMAAILLLSGGTAYYLAGGYPALIAAGSIGVDQWLTRAATRVRAVLVTAGVGVSAVTCAVIGLPIVPASQLANTPLLAIYKEAGEQVGWPQLTEAVAKAYRSLSAPEQARAVVVTDSYGQAGAVARYGPELGLPRVFSGHNGYANWGQPPETADVAIVVSVRKRGGIPPAWTASCRELRSAGIVDNGYGVPNEDQGSQIRLCLGLTKTWTQLWPELRRLS